MGAAGASILVAGTAIFGADDAERAARELRTMAERALSGERAFVACGVRQT